MALTCLLSSLISYKLQRRLSIYQTESLLRLWINPDTLQHCKKCIFSFPLFLFPRSALENENVSSRRRFWREWGRGRVRSAESRQAKRGMKGGKERSSFFTKMILNWWWISRGNWKVRSEPTEVWMQPLGLFMFPSNGSNVQGKWKVRMMKTKNRGVLHLFSFYFKRNIQLFIDFLNYSSTIVSFSRIKSSKVSDLKHIFC